MSSFFLQSIAHIKLFLTPYFNTLLQLNKNN